MAYVLYAGNHWRGQSADTKPSATTYAGYMLIEEDTGYQYLAVGDAWVDRSYHTGQADYHAQAHVVAHKAGGADPLTGVNKLGPLEVGLAHADLASLTADQHHVQLHRAAHISGGGDALLSSDLIEAIVKRLRESGGADLVLGAIADGQFLKRSGLTIVSAVPAGGGGVWTTKIKTTDQTNNTATLVDDDTLQFPTVANTQYVIRLEAFFLTNATQDSKYRMVHTGITTRVRRRIVQTTTGDVPLEIATKTAFDAADVVLSTTGANPFLEEYIILQVGATGGVFKLQWAQVTAGAGPTQCLEGSYLEYAIA